MHSRAIALELPLPAAGISGRHGQYVFTWWTMCGLVGTLALAFEVASLDVRREKSLQEV